MSKNKIIFLSTWRFFLAALFHYYHSYDVENRKKSDKGPSEYLLSDKKLGLYGSLNIEMIRLLSKMCLNKYAFSKSSDHDEGISFTIMH